MATAALISVSEYLNTSYRPDCDYIDGEVLERSLGEKPHSLLQGILFSVCTSHQQEWNLLPLLEQRVQTGPTRFRIPDLCLVDPADPDSIVHAAPYLCVEILSKDDTLRSMQQRVDDYLRMGVPNIWLLDPVLRQAWRASASGLHKATEVLTIENSKVGVNLAEVFSRLDNLLAGRL